MLIANTRSTRASPLDRLRHLACLGLLATLVACSPEQVLGGKSLPPDVPDPVTTKTPEGAMDAYRGALFEFRKAFGSWGANSFAFVTGLLTDELQAGSIGLVGGADVQQVIDGRQLPEYTDPSIDDNTTTRVTYGYLQQARGQISEARGALVAYAPAAPVALRGRLYALEGYTEVFLADLFCSGIPLSTLDFEGDYTYRPGSTTQEVYEQAITHFDSALALADDSAGVGYLARVGEARALLALGDYADAAATAADVSDDFRYEVAYSSAGAENEGNLGHDFSSSQAAATMADREGTNGLPYLSSGDPRVVRSLIGQNKYGRPLYAPAKYAANGDGSIVLASGVEARLIEAEAQLDAGDPNWLATLNALRTDGGYDTQPNAADSTRTDTLWHAGTGGVAGLAPLADPGDAAARVDLLFAERGYWLFLTGQRQGDLRRLVRQYGRAAEAVYPTGAYPGLNGRYGSDVTAPVPAEERAYNPLYRGCFSRGA